MVWPNGVRPATVAVKTVDEKARTKVEAGQKILNLFQGNFILSRYVGVMGTSVASDMFKESATDIINAFSIKDINKHLIFLLLDVFLVHFLPESITRDRRL